MRWVEDRKSNRGNVLEKGTYCFPDVIQAQRSQKYENCDEAKRGLTEYPTEEMAASSV